MNKLFLLCSLAVAHVGIAQTSVNNITTISTVPALKLPLDKSPMDMAYYPVNYPVLKIQDKATEPLVARVIYSRPQKEDRTVFGGLVEYGKVWRLGANEATEIELYKDVKVKEKKLAKGRYSIFAIPTETEWTIIFNKDTDVWGAFKYDEKKDVLRISVPVQKTTPVEAFSISFAKSNNGADMLIAWDEAMVTLPFSFK
ncbi:MAG TPA: DUF2911 domain-containing protein [Flavisolibacter sp.]|nr:DUF2911 domain-containing protein [Flavisolibacter sp.]